MTAKASTNSAASFRSRLLALRGRLPPLSSPAVPFMAGLALLSLGAFWAWPPAGLIAPGLVLLFVALAGNKAEP